MKKFITSIIFVVLAAFVATSLKEADLVVSLSNSNQIEKLSSWHDVLNTEYNAYFSWRVSKVLTTLTPASLINQYEALTAVIIFAAFIFCLGLSLLLYEILEDKNIIFPFSVALLTVSILPLFFGLSGVILLSFTFFPWLSWALIKYQNSEEKKFKFLLLILLFSFLISQSANQFSFVIVIFSIVFAKRDDSEMLSNAALLIALFGPALLQLFLVSSPNFPNYPANSHVIPDDGIPGKLHSFFGPEAPITIIDRVALKLQIKKLACFLLAFSLLSSIFLVLSNRVSKRLSKAAIVIFGLVALDIISNESFAQIMPIASLARVLPNNLFFPLTPFFLIVGLISLIAAFVRNNNCILLIILFLSLTNLTSKHSFKNYNDLLASLSPANQQLLVSPSFNLITKDGLFVLKDREKIEKAEFLQLPFKAKASKNNENISEILSDNNPRSRWAEKNGKQTGSEWLELEFEEPKALDGLELSTGVYRHDFPRGLTIKYGDTCSKNMQQIYQTKDFQGALRYTKQGHPYYGAQSDVKIYFEKRIFAKCIRVEQTAEGAPFDWSVSRVRVVRFR